MSAERMSLLVLLLGFVLALAKVLRDVLIVRQLRAALVNCTPDERVRVCLQLAQALQGSSWHVPGPWGRGAIGSGQPPGEEVADQ